MRSFFLLTGILFFGVTVSSAQENKKVAQGKLASTDVMNRQVDKKANPIDATNFNYGVNELKTKSYESALKTFNNFLSANTEDYNAYYNRGLAYYYLEDIEHACMDWKYAAYFNVYPAKKNYSSVCDPSIGVEFLNGGLVRQPSLYDEKYEESIVDTLPSFPGGQEEFNNFIQKNLKVPSSKRKEFLKSRIIIRFKVTEDGAVLNPVAVNEESSALTKEAIRVVSIMPKWIPATRNGKPVATEFYYPIVNGYDTTNKANKFYKKAMQLYSESDYTEALKNFSLAIDINEDDEDAYFARASCYMKLGDTAKACEDWKKPLLQNRISVMKSLNKHCGTNISSDKIPGIRNSNQDIYLHVDGMPTFPDGEKAMQDYITKFTVYPAEARKKKITGRVYVSFIVDKDGYVRDPKVVRGIGGGCDEEAMRVIKMLARWNPGYSGARPLNVAMTVPVEFIAK
jgi:TonB family protein